jgi:hypothetical protein
MAKFAATIVLDAPADIIDQCDKMVACSAQPTTYTEANATFALADVAMTPDTDYTKAAGDVSGRKVTMAAKNTVTVDTSGTATHVALIRTADSSLRFVTTCTSQALTAGNTCNFPAWDIETGSPT